jgi:hypothetical protein
MRWSEIIQEAPRAIDQPTAVDYDDPDYNRAFAAKTLAKQAEIIEQTVDYRIIRTGDGHRGWIMLYDKKTKKADYVVQYETRKWPFLKARTVTQIIAWRDPISQHARGLTRRMFFDFLLNRYGTIMSDLVQTPQGNDFWRARLSDAAHLGHRVGIVKLNSKSVSWFNANTTSFDDWLGVRAKTYDTPKHFEAIRYLISK